MDSREYWKHREREQLKHNITEETEYRKSIGEIYDYMMDQIQREINGFYVKYAKKEGITLSEARKRVSKLDIEEYGRKAAKYVKEKDFSDVANEEMRLYNATMKINRLEMLKAKIGLELVDGFNELQKYFDRILTKRTLDEFERQAGILGDTVGDREKAAHVIVNASFHNASFSDRIWMYQDMMKAELSKLLQVGLIQGKHPRVLARHLVKLFGVRRSDAERLMQTELARVQTEAQKRSFERNGYDRYEFIALETACKICKAIDGKHFRTEDMMPGENAPPMHPRCRCSTAAYVDREEVEKWLESHGESDIIEPEDRGDVFTDLNNLSDNLLEQSLQVNNFLNTLGVRDSKWSGITTVVDDRKLPTALGRTKANGDIWLRNDAGIKTILHEHLHTRSSSWMSKKSKKDLGFEEGACELLAEEICKKEGVAYRATYAKYVDPLRKYNELLGKYDSDYDFAVDLFNVDMDKREQWLLDLADEYGSLKALALKKLVRKMRRGSEK